MNTLFEKIVAIALFLFAVSCLAGTYTMERRSDLDDVGYYAGLLIGFGAFSAGIYYAVVSLKK